MPIPERTSSDYAIWLLPADGPEHDERLEQLIHGLAAPSGRDDERTADFRPHLPLSLAGPNADGGADTLEFEALQRAVMAATRRDTEPNHERRQLALKVLKSERAQSRSLLGNLGHGRARESEAAIYLPVAEDDEGSKGLHDLHAALEDSLGLAHSAHRHRIPLKFAASGVDTPRRGELSTLGQGSTFPRTILFDQIAIVRRSGENAWMEVETFDL